jgi:hypothetical protein
MIAGRELWEDGRTVDRFRTASADLGDEARRRVRDRLVFAASQEASTEAAQTSTPAVVPRRLSATRLMAVLLPAAAIAAVLVTLLIQIGRHETGGRAIPPTPTVTAVTSTPPPTATAQPIRVRPQHVTHRRKRTPVPATAPLLQPPATQIGVQPAATAGPTVPVNTIRATPLSRPVRRPHRPRPAAGHTPMPLPPPAPAPLPPPRHRQTATPTPGSGADPVGAPTATPFIKFPPTTQPTAITPLPTEPPPSVVPTP